MADTTSMEIDDPAKVLEPETSFTKTSDEIDLEGEGLDDDSDKMETTIPATKPFIVLVACCAALGGLIFGYDIAGAGATFVMDGFQKHFEWECAVDDFDCTPASESEKDFDKGKLRFVFRIYAIKSESHYFLTIF